MDNLVNNKEYIDIQADLESRLINRLKANGDEFLPGSHYLEKWDIKVNEEGTVPYRHLN